MLIANRINGSSVDQRNSYHANMKSISKQVRVLLYIIVTCQSLSSCVLQKKAEDKKIVDYNQQAQENSIHPTLELLTISEVASIQILTSEDLRGGMRTQVYKPKVRSPQQRL